MNSSRKHTPYFIPMRIANWWCHSHVGYHFYRDWIAVQNVIASSQNTTWSAHVHSLRNMHKSKQDTFERRKSAIWFRLVVAPITYYCLVKWSNKTLFSIMHWGNDCVTGCTNKSVRKRAYKLQLNFNTWTVRSIRLRGREFENKHKKTFFNSWKLQQSFQSFHWNLIGVQFM